MGGIKTERSKDDDRKQAEDRKSTRVSRVDDVDNAVEVGDDDVDDVDNAVDRLDVELMGEEIVMIGYNSVDGRADG
eukprot:gene830-4110_t